MISDILVFCDYRVSAFIRFCVFGFWGLLGLWPFEFVECWTTGRFVALVSQKPLWQHSVNADFLQQRWIEEVASVNFAIALQTQ